MSDINFLPKLEIIRVLYCMCTLLKLLFTYSGSPWLVSVMSAGSSGGSASSTGASIVGESTRLVAARLPAVFEVLTAPGSAPFTKSEVCTYICHFVTKIYWPSALVTFDVTFGTVCVCHYCCLPVWRQLCARIPQLPVLTTFVLILLLLFKFVSKLAEKLSITVTVKCVFSDRRECNSSIQATSAIQNLRCSWKAECF